MNSDLVFQNLLDLVHKHWDARKAEIHKYWDFYNGDNQRWYLPQFDGEDYQDYSDRLRKSVVENHCRGLNNTATGYLYGKGEKISRRAEDSKLQEILNERIWKTNHMWSFHLERALMQSVTGFSIIALDFVDMRTSLPFVNKSKEDFSQYGSVKYRIMDSSDTMPLSRAEDSTMLGGILKYYKVDNASGLTAFDRLNYKTFETNEVIEFIDDKVWLKWVDEALVTENGNVNIYGDVRIPFVLFRNPGDPKALEGDPDHADVIPLNIDLNERSNDDRNVISYHSFPIIMFLNGGKMPKNWKRGPSTGLEFDGDGKAEYLTWDNVIEASKERGDKLRQAMNRVSGYSDISQGSTENLGSVRSGAGLKTLFINDMLSTMTRQAFAQVGEQWLIASTAKILEYWTDLEFESYESEVAFPEDFIGIDEWLRWQIDRDKMDAGVLGTDEVVKKEHPELLTEEEIRARIDTNQTYIRPTYQSRKEESPDIKSLEQEV